MGGSVKGFIRCLPKERLDELLFVAGLDPGEINGIDHNLASSKGADAVLKVLEQAGPKISEYAYSLIGRAGQFRTAHGLRALRSVVIAEDLDLQAFDAIEDVRACAVWLLARSARAFEHALAANYADTHTFGRMWSGFVFEGGG